jgi:hypothetical protein
MEDDRIKGSVNILTMADNANSAKRQIQQVAFTVKE